MPIFFDPRTGQYYQITPGGQRTALKMQTNVDIDKNPGSSGSTSGPGSTPPTASPTPTPGTSAAPATSGAAGTGGGGTVNTQGGNISQGNIYGGTVNNAAGGGTGSLNASGGSNNIYKETNAAPATTPAAGTGATPDNPSGGCPEGQFPDDETGECRSLPPCGDGPPCPIGKMCQNGNCVDIPSRPPTEAQSFQQFMSSKGVPDSTGGAPWTSFAANPYMAQSPATGESACPVGYTRVWTPVPGQRPVGVCQPINSQPSYP